MINTYVATAAIDIIALLFLSAFLRGHTIMSNQRIRAFLNGILLTVLVIIAEAGTRLTGNAGDELRSLHVLSNVIGFALAPIIPIALIAIFDSRSLKKYVWLLLPAMLNVITAALSPFFGWIFLVDANNQYKRGPFFVLFVAVYIMNVLLLLVITMRIGQKHLYPIKGRVLILSLFVLAGTFVQLLYPTVFVSWHCVTLSIFLYYFILSEFEGSFDSLTGLYNRAAYEKVSGQLVSRKVFSVIVMDINDLKVVNDTYGHEYGDAVLKKIAAIIKDSFSSRCSCYRIGGDEFCLICRDANREKLEHQLKSMTDRLTNERQTDSWLPTVAYGYSMFHGNGIPDVQQLLKDADNQMYYFKQLQKSNAHVNR